MALCHNQSYQKDPHGLWTMENGPPGAHQNLTFMIALYCSKKPDGIVGCAVRKR